MTRQAPIYSRPEPPEQFVSWHPRLLRQREPKPNRIETLLKETPQTITLSIQREKNNRRFFEFFKYFWPVISEEELQLNWHIEYLCNELQEVSTRVINNEDKEYDLLINIPPGTTKSSIVSVLWPVWIWTIDHTTKFITASHGATLSLDLAVKSREVIRSEKFREMYPELTIKEDSDNKSNFQVVKEIRRYYKTRSRFKIGGNRFSTSVGSSFVGFHGHILIVDDPIDPYKAISEKERMNANRWIVETLSTRKINKARVPLVMVMQRVHEEDPTAYYIKRKAGKGIKHIRLPGEINTETYRKLVSPPELVHYYIGGLLDPVRLNQAVLDELKATLGQYGYAGQVGQRPTPPEGGMFKVNMLRVSDNPIYMHEIERIIRYWDKAGSFNAGAYTAGVKMAKMKNGRYLIIDVVRGRWAALEREQIIKATAEADGKHVEVWIEQEPGSGGKESAESTIRNLAGFKCYKELPKGDKALRADPFSVQVNAGNVSMQRAGWNDTFINELEFFPFSQYKDQVDAAGAAFAQLANKRRFRTR